MTFERLQASDKRLLAVVALLIAGSVWYTSHNYRAAFPQASLELQYSKSEITQMARQFLTQRGLSTEGYRNLTLFDPDEDARLFLEHELGLEEANRLMQRQVAVWRWRARWFKPPEKEELVVWLSPGGRLVGFHHIIPEAAPGARLAKDEARALALEFLNAQTTTPQRLIEERLVERPRRYDYVFTWEQEGFHAKDGAYRRQVVVQGGQVGRYSEFLHVPQRWEREYAGLRSSNDLYMWIAQAAYVLLILAAIGMLIYLLRRRQIRWRPLLVISGAVAVLVIINQWNQLPFFIDSMPTSTRYRDMVLLGVLSALGAGVGYFFYIVLAAAPGEPLYRASQPSRLSLAALVSARGIRTREFFRAAVAGYGFAAVHLAYVVAFYLVGRRLGVWAPQDVAYSDLLSTAVPWIYPLTIGLLAACSEEFWFRLLAIPLLQRYLRLRWLAVVIPAFLWGFLHSNYPQEPGFIRGIEIGVIGVAVGFLMLRFGIVATLIWHYTIDAFLISTILFQADRWYFWVAGALVSGAGLVPLGISLFHYRRHRGFLADPGMQNANVSVPPPPPPREPGAAPGEAIHPRWRARWLYAGALAFLVAGLFLKPVTFGDFIKVRLSPADAAAVGDRAVAERGVKPAAWRRAVQFIANLDAAEFEYIRRLEGAQAANAVVRDRTFHGVWLVRYFRPLQHEEWRVFVNQQGIAYRVDHVVDEKAAGANLSPEQARRLAERYLSERQQVPLARYRLVDSSDEKRDNRTDHDFVWEARELKWGEATARISLSVIGDEVAYYRRFLKLPEEWLRQFHRPRLQDYLLPSLLGAIAVPLLVVFIRRLSARPAESPHHFRWKPCLLAGAAATLLAALVAANQWPAALASYDTAQPMRNFLGQWLLSNITQVVLAGLGAFLVTLAADVFLQMAAGFRASPVPSLARTAAIAVLLWGLLRVLNFCALAVPGDRYSLPLWKLTGAATLAPALEVIGRSALFVPLLLGPTVIAVAAAVRYLRRRSGYTLIAVLVALVALSRSTNLWQWLFYSVEGAVLIGLVVFLIRTCGVDLAGFGVADRPGGVPHSHLRG